MKPPSFPPPNKPRPGGAVTLQTPVQFVPGVGPHRAAILAKVGINTVEDLVFYFPRDHQDRRIVPIKELGPHQKGAIQGTVQFFEIRRIGKSLGQGRAIIKDASGSLEAIWFKRLSFKFDSFSALRRDIKIGAEIVLYGQMVTSRDHLSLRVDQYETAPENIVPTTHANGIVPVYPLTEGMGEKWFRELAARVVPQVVGEVADPIPEEIRNESGFPPIQDSIRQYHFPDNWKKLGEARERLAFDEFFFLELALEVGRYRRQKESKGYPSLPQKNLLTPFKNSLGYSFTAAQKKAINEIFKDMAAPAPMNRLLQGDVGSGKTVVALSAALLAIENGLQAAFLCPTEILAEQHYLGIKKFFEKLPIEARLLTGSTPVSEKKKILKGLSENRVQFLVGTHAILNQKVTFQRLGLAVIDEQHRFGVRQRERLLKSASLSKGEDLFDEYKPDVLIMTATPIPRTLALSLYGDLDVSIINEMPPGRLPVETKLGTEAAARQKIRETVQRGEQVFYVLPLVDESEKLSQREGKSVRAAKIDFEKLKTQLPEIRFGLLHGQMKGDEKRKVMGAFRAREIDVLVATPVIEVGIDIPNASLIIIMNPERFGLAQLHQLRGRVGRGGLPSSCHLVVDDSGIIPERLQAFAAILDGFKLAEEDLKLRGPGEILGEAQHGVPFFKVGNLVRDGLLIGRAKNLAQDVIEGKFKMTHHESRQLNRTLYRRFGSKVDLYEVG